MRTIIVSGPYGSGKTQTIKGLVRGAAESGLRIGAFVAESANIALDQDRYNIGNNAVGVSFASVCCPTVADMQQAIGVALRGNSYDLLFLEPPGNMHPPLIAQIAVERGFSIDQVVMLVSQRDFDDDRHLATFHSGLEIASVVGVTHADGSVRGDVMDAIKMANPNAPIITFSSGGLEYRALMEQKPWSLGRLAGTSESDARAGHDDHYEKVLRVFNPELGYAEICSILQQIAETGLVERGKGRLPSHNKDFDIKRTYLEITTPKEAIDPNGMGYLICFGKDGLPLELINKVSMAPEQRVRETFSGSPLERKFSIFGRLYQDSSNRERDVFANGEVTYTYSPLDEAEKIAMEIRNDSGDSSALRMILPVYHATRLYALEELSKVQDRKTSFPGVHISAVLINTSLATDPVDYPRLVDQAQALQIKDRAVRAMFNYSSSLRADEIKEFPRYESAVGPYFLKAARTGWDELDEKQRPEIQNIRRSAVDNMVRIHRESGLVRLADDWEAWGREE